MKKLDKIIILVGYASSYSLWELDKLVRKYKIKNIILILGVYPVYEMPKSLKLAALWINEEWQKDGIGEIKLVYPFRYHGKLYCFFKDDQIQPDKNNMKLLLLQTTPKLLKTL